MRERAQKSERGQSGFTLLEVMIAFAILSVGVLSIGMGQLSALKLTSTSKNSQQAMYLAEELMETFHSLPFSPGPPWGPTFFTTAVVDQTNPANATLPGNPHAPLGPANPDQLSYRRSWTIAPNQAPHNLTEITVMVTWNNSNGIERTAILQSIKGP